MAPLLVRLNTTLYRSVLLYLAIQRGQPVAPLLVRLNTTQNR